jgi:hypothetical protein
MLLYTLFYSVIPSVHIMMHGGGDGDGTHDMLMYAWKVAGGYRPDLSDVAPPEVNAVIEACWKGLPSLRPTAQELVATLEGMQAAGEPGEGLFFFARGVVGIPEGWCGVWQWAWCIWADCVLPRRRVPPARAGRRQGLLRCDVNAGFQVARARHEIKKARTCTCAHCTFTCSR